MKKFLIFIFLIKILLQIKLYRKLYTEPSGIYEYTFGPIIEEENNNFNFSINVTEKDKNAIFIKYNISKNYSYSSINWSNYYDLINITKKYEKKENEVLDNALNSAIYIKNLDKSNNASFHFLFNHMFLRLEGEGIPFLYIDGTDNIDKNLLEISTSNLNVTFCSDNTPFIILNGSVIYNFYGIFHDDSYYSPFDHRISLFKFILFN